MAATDTQEILDEIGGEKTADQSEIDAIVAELELMSRADIRNIYTPDGKPMSPADWPEAEAKAVVRYSISPAGAVNIQFQDRRALKESIVKLKGLGKVEGEERNPLEALLDSIPRDDLVEIVSALKALGDVRGADKDLD